MSIEGVLAPREILADDNVIVCEHRPWTCWTHFEKGEVSAAFEGSGTEIDVDHIALCESCHALPIEEVRVKLAKRVIGEMS